MPSADGNAVYSRNALIEAIPGIAWIMNAQGTQYLYMNRGMRKVLGYDPEEVRHAGPKFVIERMHPDDLERVLKYHHEKVKALEAQPEHQDAYVHVDEYRVRHADGEWRWLRSSAIVYEREEDGPNRGAILTVLGIAQDVTEMKRMETRLRVADRLKSTGLLAAGVSHEINNPLAHVSASLEMLIEDLERGNVERALERATAAQASAKRIAKIVADLNAFARTREDEISDIDLTRVVESLLPLMQGQVRNHAKLIFEPLPAPCVRANEGRLGQILLNLIVNAVQAIVPGDVEANAVWVRTGVRASKWAFLEVQDTGVGIAPENLKRVFEPFFTTKPANLGTGLGLAICQDIARSLGGDIEVESEPGKGSTFRVLLPIAR